MAEWLGVLKVAGSRQLSYGNFEKTFSVHPAVNGYSSELGKVKISEEEEWRPTSVTSSSVRSGSLATTSPPLLTGKMGEMILVSELTAGVKSG